MQNIVVTEQHIQMDCITFAVHSQRLENEGLSPDEILRLKRMIREKMTQDEGIAYLKREMGIANEVCK